MQRGHLMIHSNSPADNSVALSRLGLYFPYIHFRDDNWVKVAALYWPKMARIVPVGYPLRDSDTVRALSDKLNWTFEIPPEEARDLVAPIFADFIAELENNEDRPSYEIGQMADWLVGSSSHDQVEADPGGAPSWGNGPGEPPIWGQRTDGSLAGIYSTEFEPNLCGLLLRSGLAGRALANSMDYQTKGILEFIRPWDAPRPWSGLPLDHGPMREAGWLVMHRDLAWIYKCLLSETLANHNRLALTTDQVNAHAAASGLSARQLALGGISGQNLVGDLVTTFGLMAIETVMPRDLAGVSVDKIIMIRKRYGDQFDLWHDYVDRVGTDLAEQLANVESPQVLRQYLNEAARKYAEAPVNRLRQGLASVGVDTIIAAVNKKFEIPAAIAATGLATGSPVAVAAGAAVGIAELRRGAKDKFRAQLSSPSSYLLNVKEELEPSSWVQRIMVMMRAAAGLRG
jgi:Family of unknown function (DUF6236)